MDVRLDMYSCTAQVRKLNALNALNALLPVTPFK